MSAKRREPEERRRRGRRRWSELLKRLALHLILGLGAVVMVLPFLWMISTSLKTREQALTYPPIWIPNPIRWDNYTTIWKLMPFHRFYLNSLKVSICITLGQMVTCSMGGYAFAKLKFPGRDLFFLIYLSTLMIPFVVTLIPMFIIMRTLGWLNTHAAVIVPALFSAFGTFLMRQFFLTIPDELIDAALIDGANPLQIFIHIMLPLSKPALATLGSFAFIASWNDFLWPLLMLQRVELKTLPLGLSYFSSLYVVQWHYLMAASVTALLPMLAVFLFIQRYYTKGITLTGLKG